MNWFTQTVVVSLMIVVLGAGVFLYLDRKNSAPREADVAGSSVLEVVPLAPQPDDRPRVVCNPKYEAACPPLSPVDASREAKALAVLERAPDAITGESWLEVSSPRYVVMRGYGVRDWDNAVIDLSSGALTDTFYMSSDTAGVAGRYVFLNGTKFYTYAFGTPRALQLKDAALSGQQTYNPVLYCGDPAPMNEYEPKATSSGSITVAIFQRPERVCDPEDPAYAVQSDLPEVGTKTFRFSEALPK